MGLGAPPADLSSFPSQVLSPSVPLFRIHRADRQPWWFCCDGFCRFDLAAPLGTCYAAEDALGAFVESFRDFGAVAERDIRARRMATLRVGKPVRLADSTAARARRFGITGEIHSTPDYAATQVWATAFAAAGFAGIRCFARHDPSATLRVVALFGEAGVASGRKARSAPISGALLERAAVELGIEVLPEP